MKKVTKKKKPAKEYLPAIKSQAVHAAPPGMNSMYVMQVFENADLRFRMPGLIKVLAKYKMPVSDIPAGTCILFVNRRRDFINLIVGNASRYPVLATYRFPPGKSLPRKGLEEIAKAFRSPRQIDADKRLYLALDKMKNREGLDVKCAE